LLVKLSNEVEKHETEVAKMDQNNPLYLAVSVNRPHCIIILKLCVWQK